MKYNLKKEYFLLGISIGVLLTSICIYLIVLGVDAKNNKIKKENMVVEALKREDKSEPINKDTDEVKKDEVKKDEVKKDEVKKDEVKKDEVKKDEVKKDEVKKDEVKVIEIFKGYYSMDVAKKLEEEGIIKDAQKFDKYLIENNLNRIIRTGQIEIKSNMTYKEISDMLIVN